MKKTDKVLIFLVISVIAVILLTVVSIKVKVSGNDLSVKGRKFRVSGNIVEKSYDIKDFKGIDIQGVWATKIIKGEEYKILISADENYFNEIAVEKNNDILLIKSELRSFGHKKKDNKIEIIMPEIAYIKLKGVNNFDLLKFICDKLEIQLEGVHNLEIINSEISKLLLACEGVINIDSDRSKVNSADISSEGMNKIDLNMTGGKITGKTEGVLNLNYKGSIDSIDIKKDGILNINKH